MYSSADRCAAIATPLRYTQLVTRKKIVIFFVSIWLISVGVVVSSFFIKEYGAPLGATPNAQLVEEGLQQPSQSITITRIVHVTGDESVSVVPQASSYPGTNSNVNANANPYISIIPTTAANMRLELEGLREDDDRDFLNHKMNISSAQQFERDTQSQQQLGNKSGTIKGQSPFEFRVTMGICLPKMGAISIVTVFWISVWILLILVGPMITLLICDFTVLSIARKQRHRIIMALYQITAVTQVTVTGSKGPPMPANGKSYVHT